MTNNHCPIQEGKSITSTVDLDVFHEADKNALIKIGEFAELTISSNSVTIFSCLVPANYLSPEFFSTDHIGECVKQIPERNFRQIVATRAIQIIVAIYTGSLLIGCQTSAQRQTLLIQEGFRNAGRNMEDCMKDIELNVKYQILFKYIPKGNNDATLEQLTSTKVPSDEEAKLIIDCHKEILTCRKNYIENLSNITPGLVPLYINTYNSVDFILADLVQKKITWGEANKRYSTIKIEFATKFKEKIDELKQELQANHQMELEKRQAALDSLARWNYQQQILMQNQQTINSLNRPIQTDCTKFGNSINCTSR